MQKDEMRIFSGSSNPALAQSVCDHLRIPLGRAKTGRFPDGEIEIKIEEDVRGADVFIVQSTCPPVNEHWMELLLLIDAFRRASAYRITAVMPYYGYSRQDRKAEGRVPISGKLVANLLTAAGVHRVLAMDLHAAQIQGFFDIPLDHLFAYPVLCQYWQAKAIPKTVIVAPDVGRASLAREYAKRLGLPIAVTDKVRVDASHTRVLHIIGEVKDCNILLIDDIISTGTSLSEAIKALKAFQAADIYVAATHPVLANHAADKLIHAGAKEVIVTNTIPLKEEDQRNPQIKVISVAALLSEAIRRIYQSESISAMFDEGKNTLFGGRIP